MDIKTEDALRRIEDLQRELEHLRRDLLQQRGESRKKPSLFGSVRGGDITEEMIEQAGILTKDRIILESEELT
ncbi:MAG: hypothetical protein R6V59_02585 [Dehalococcoidia bacterium]